MRDAARIVQIALRGGRVTLGFRSALFEASNRAGMTPNEFVLTATGERLRQLGSDFPGIFPGSPDESLPAGRPSLAAAKGAER